MGAKHALVVGSNGGIGKALVRALLLSGDYSKIFAASRRPDDPADARIAPLAIDLLEEPTLAAAAKIIAGHGPLDLMIVASGRLHRGADVRPEKSLRDIDQAAMSELLAVNALGPALAAKHFLPLLARRDRAVAAFLSARVGSIGDNRLGGWYSYRASKAALNALVRCFAIENARQNPDAVVVALHPGTVDTALSAPFQARINPSSLLSADQSAEHLLAVIDGLIPSDSGGFFAWNGEPIPF
jgi:NAD(P)-dependent dehydrogenase (short-subunit alcohol dehydrogenase family)